MWDKRAVDFLSVALRIDSEQQMTYSLRNASHFYRPVDEGIFIFSAVYPTERCV